MAAESGPLLVNPLSEESVMILFFAIFEAVLKRLSANHNQTLLRG